MTYSEHEKCVEWIKEYISPSKNVNHMHSDVALRIMLEEDTRVITTRPEFCRLMGEFGFEPVNKSAKRLEFRISSMPLRRRPNAKVNGWMAAGEDRDRRKA